MPILDRMLNERINALDELLIDSRNEVSFPEAKPKLKKAITYWEFEDDKQLRNFRNFQNKRKPLDYDDMEVEEEDENGYTINIYGEDGEIIESEEINLKEEEKETKKQNKTNRIYEKRKSKEKEKEEEKEEEEEEEK